MPALPMANLDEYWHSVYPLASSLCIISPSDIKFFYSNHVPVSVITTLRAQNVTNSWTTTNFSAPVLHAPYRPSYYENTTFQLSMYDPDAWWTYDYYIGFPDHTAVESMHKLDSNSERTGSLNWSTTHYPSQGFWTYYTRGSGVWINLGKTLQSPNKIAALHYLGMTFQEIVDTYWNTSLYFPRGGDCEAGPRFPAESWANITQHLLSPAALNLDPEELLQLAAYGNRRLATKFNLTLHDLRMLNRMTQIFSADNDIILRAKADGYDSVQFTTQPNGCRGWAHEIVMVGGNASQPTWGDFYSMVKKAMLVFDPCDVDAQLGGALVDELGEREACDFPAASYRCIYCAQSPIQVESCANLTSGW